MNNPTRSVRDEANFNIGAVSRMTGIPINTIHAWERRYAFPLPSAHTPGGHRLYSEQDVTLLRAIKARIDQGISAHQAVLAVRNMDLEGRLPPDRPPIHFEPPEQPPASPAGHVQLAEALFQHDLVLADRLMSEMLAFSSPEKITLNVIGPLLAEMGQAWQAGRITVSDEHLASNYLRQRLLMWLVTGPPVRASSPIVLACAPGEWHEGSLLMFGVLLRRQGWPVAYLGQNVPFPGLAALVKQVHARALVLVGMLAESARLLADWPEWIQQTAGMPLVTFAGRAFVIQPELKDRVQGIYLGDRIQDGLVKIEESMR